MNYHGDHAMAALELARSSQREYIRYQQLLGETMTQMSHVYGDASGVAHAAELSALVRGILDRRPAHSAASPASYFTVASTGRPSTSSHLGREPFEYYAGLDE